MYSIEITNKFKQSLKKVKKSQRLKKDRNFF